MSGERETVEKSAGKIRSSLYNPIECTNICNGLSSSGVLFFRRLCSVIYHERAMCIHVPLDGLLSLQHSCRFVARAFSKWNCIRYHLYARKYKLFTHDSTLDRSFRRHTRICSQRRKKKQFQ